MGAWLYCLPLALPWWPRRCAGCVAFLSPSVVLAFSALPPSLPHDRAKSRPERGIRPGDSVDRTCQ
eukprot:scaffold366382_cov53-Attheya_sp.AAC.3